ncbi:hypothetical protein BN938_1525 [Mucinivorans hirudinis]|uniref:Uncharacterized protein n=1 Tax=Mucinivorans hirudinis TaxID=1433126 RepID=A0A060R894_9BACT|nr:hypothetical protein BN938_1525 [Mucinivorans hirudinis]
MPSQYLLGGHNAEIARKSYQKSKLFNAYLTRYIATPKVKKSFFWGNK